MILKHISRMLCLLISYSKFTRTATKTALTVRISCATVRIHKCNEEESIYFIEVLQRTFRQAERNETDRWRRWLLSGAPNGHRDRTNGESKAATGSACYSG